MQSSGPGDGSSLARLSKAELTEVAVEQLMGEGNSLDGAQPTLRLSKQDQEFLALEVFVPALADRATRQTLEAARAAFEEAGGAREASYAEPEMMAFFAVANPMVRLAFIERLLQGHPRRAELMDQAFWHAVQHDRVRFVIYTDEESLKLKPELGESLLDRKVYSGMELRVDTWGLQRLWEVGKGGRGIHSVRVAVPIFLPARDLAELSLDELGLAGVLLAKSPSGSAHAREAKAMLARSADLLRFKRSELVWNPADRRGGTSPDFRAEVKKALAILGEIPKGSPVYAEAQERIAAGSAAIRLSKDAADKAEREEQQRIQKFLSALTRDQRRVYDELGMPDEDDPGPRGGRIWRYRDAIYSDAFGQRVLIAYRWKVYTFERAGR